MFPARADPTRATVFPMRTEPKREDPSPPDAEQIRTALDAVYGEETSEVDPALAAMQRAAVSLLGH